MVQLPSTAPSELRRAILLALAEQSTDIAKTIVYFIKERSVGELIAIRELRAKGIKNPGIPIIKLIEIGFIERGLGCYNLAKSVREWVNSRIPRSPRYFRDETDPHYTNPLPLIESILEELGLM
ncbi:MAG: hypothetical protein DRN95_06875 [Candidatus Hydrothermarchaeota archaeon]|nr:MAG: hypothetical protein DRN95_06875 [Candidatus Hydrothermarchaeota archaeon]